jgi:hypothetical protein
MELELFRCSESERQKLAPPKELRLCPRSMHVEALPNTLVSNESIHNRELSVTYYHITINLFINNSLTYSIQYHYKSHLSCIFYYFPHLFYFLLSTSLFTSNLHGQAGKVVTDDTQPAWWLVAGPAAPLRAGLWPSPHPYVGLAWNVDVQAGFHVADRLAAHKSTATHAPSLQLSS